MKKKIIDNIKTLIYALIIALFIRSFFYQPFYIPSSSMEPNLLVGDRLFVSKYTYGYSRHSFPFSPNLFSKRLLSKYPSRGDIVVFKTPADNRTDYIKRFVGLPGDEIQITDGNLFLNGQKVMRNKINLSTQIKCGDENINVDAYEEVLPNEVSYIAVYRKNGSMQNSDLYKVPENHYFFLGDNRDCSKDSRYLNSVGYVSFVNLVGKARVIFFSNNKKKGSLFQFWKWNNSIRADRIFKKIN